MRFTIQESIKENITAPVVGNVYNIRGGRGAREGHMHVIIGIKNTAVTTVTVDKDGEICGGSCYGYHYFEEKTPIAYCSGLDELSFEIRSLR